jgi:hypothetical protein
MSPLYSSGKFRFGAAKFVVGGDREEQIGSLLPGHQHADPTFSRDGAVSRPIPEKLKSHVCDQSGA